MKKFTLGLRMIKHIAIHSLSTLLLAFCLTSIVHASEIEGLGYFSGATSSTGRGVSPDGSVVVGSANIGMGMSEAFRWTSSGGMTRLGFLTGGDTTYAFDASTGGSVVVGYGNSALGFQAFQWTAAGGLVGLGDLAGGAFNSYAYGVNADGSVIVGIGVSGSGQEAFRWTNAGGMVGLGDLAGGTFNSQASGVSADGSVVVGYSDSTLGYQAFRWTDAGGMVGLGDLAGGMYLSTAEGVSADGSVVVGYSRSASGSEAFRWNASDGMVGLGDLAGGAFDSQALDASSDGSVIVGYGSSGTGERAFRWTESSGMQSLEEYLTSNGVDLTGWTLRQASAISDDGNTIVGSSDSPAGSETFIAREGGVITTTELNNSLFQMGGVTNSVTAMAKVNVTAMMDASHGAILNTTSGLSSGDEMTGRTQFWVVGSLISDRSFSGEDLGGEGGIGLTRYLANGLSVGGGVFSGKRSLDTSYGGNQRTTLIGPGVFVAYAPDTHGLRVETGGSWSYLDLNLKRGYQNGASSAQSSGTTHGQALGLYGRIGWVFPVVDRFSLQPFAQYNWQRVEINGYTESGGPFPATYDKREESINRTRLGLQSQYAYNQAWDFWAWAAWDHRFESTGSSMSGSLVGLQAFNYGGGPVDQNWGDAGVGAKWRPYEGFETFSRLGFGLDSQYNAEPDLALTVGLGWDL